ncbi:hypothetical protein ACF0H5_012317 [Mactra antiquata]
MVSLSEDHGRNRGHFFEEQKDDDELLTDSATLSLVVSMEQSGRKINTTWIIAVEIVLLIGVWVCSFILPAYCNNDKCGSLAIPLTLYIVGGVWFIQLIIDRFYRHEHYKNRLCGYLNFYRQTRNIRRLPLTVSSAAIACLLIVTQILFEKCNVPETAKCGSIPVHGYIQIIVSISCAIQIILLTIYSVRTINFNRSGASPDVNQEEMVTSFLQTNSSAGDIGFRDGGLMDQVLERQADMIRYLKQHNEHLSRKILALSEENHAFKQQKK